MLLRPSPALLALAALAQLARPEEAAAPDKGPLGQLEWRLVGPLNPSGRVADVEGVPGDPRIVYVGAASGGVWKTDDGGLTFRPIFDEQPVASIGDIALAPGNADVIYVGTGESNARNSVSSGNGVYRSTDGGQTFTHLGLEDTRHISRVLVHPTNHETVLVGALGHLFGPNAERGVFRTEDGGKTWQKTLFLDDRHGVADMDMDPSNPNVVYATLWYFDRKPWTHASGDEKGGLYRSVDGGRTWKKLAKGLPKLMGRIGVAVAPSDPKVVYVIVESNEGTLFRSDDRGDSFRKVSDKLDLVSRGLYYTHLRVNPKNADDVITIASILQRSIDGGKTFKRISRTTHVDFHALWIDPTNPDRMWQGQDGGVAVTYDGGKAWEPIRNLPIAQFYQIHADSQAPFYFTGGGLQDNGTWWGPSRTREPAGILEDDWRMPSFGDAYFVVTHPDDPYLMLSESQGGNIVKTDLRTRQQRDVSPQPKRNDGGPASGLKYRFNWNSPIVASPHDGKTVYFAGNVVFRSADFGETWETISPDLTTNDPEKIKDAGGPVWKENTTAEYHCTIISFAESPARRGVLWAGTDDGNLQASQDGGKTWSNVVRNVPGVAAFSPVSHVEPSRTEAGTAWVAFDRHMFDDPQPYLFKTTDFGKTWTRVPTTGLPKTAFLWVVRQDPKNARLLYAGTELGLYATRDEGRSWSQLHLKNLPVVAVHDILIHPGTNDLLIGTHGRALWIFDDAAPLQSFDPSATPRNQLFETRPGVRFSSRFTRYGLGDKAFRAKNPPPGALITYSLKERVAPSDTKDEAAKAKASERVKIEIGDASGAVVRTLKKVGLEKGLNRVAWDLRADPPYARKDGEPEEDDFDPPPVGAYVLPGTYTVRLTVDGETHETPVSVAIEPGLKVSAADLEAQARMARELVALQSQANRSLRALDATRKQIQERRSLLKDLGARDEAAAAALKAAEDVVAAAQDALAKPETLTFYATGPRVSERLRELHRNVDQGFAAPTAPQREHFEELKADVGAALEQASKAEGALAKLNEALAKAGLAAVVWPRL